MSPSSNFTDHRNVGQISRPPLPATTRDKLKEILKLEYELYEFAKQRLDRQIKQYL